MKRDYKKPRTRTLALETSYGMMAGGTLENGGETKDKITEAYSKTYDFSNPWDEDEEEEEAD